ncbi:MAG TPA: DUF5069 domain-containing protein [Verrucomicrobiae bacterium]|nr:DUF5069 domain-containing protein [Verrucomicrobiae bacterium]
MNEQKLKTLAKDLRKEDPRHVSTRMAGVEGAARALDKCRATLLGWNGEFQYGCPMDQMFFQEAGVDKEQFKDFVATGASDEEVELWLKEHAARTVSR